MRFEKYDGSDPNSTRFFGVTGPDGKVSMVGGTVAAPGPDWDCRCGRRDTWDLRQGFWRVGDEFILYKPSTGSVVYPYNEGLAKCTPKELWICPTCQAPSMLLYMDASLFPNGIPSRSPA